MHINILAVGIATLVGYVVGSLWYLALGASWRRAVGWAETIPPYQPSPVELALGFLGQLVMAFALAGLLTHMGGASLKTGVITAFEIWAGFILPTLGTNVVFQRRNRTLIWQDGMHWLLILLVQGGVLGLRG